MKVLLVTGGSRGIGRAVVELAARRCYRVAFTFRDNEAAAREVEAAVAQEQGEVVPFRMDVSNEADVVSAFDAAVDRFGGLDGVVNNAGIVAPLMPLSRMTAERMKRIIDVNVFGSYLVAREAVRRMSRSMAGRGAF